MIVWLIKHRGNSLVRTFGGTKFFFLAIFMILITSNFSLHYYYVHNFENHCILYIQYQFTIIVCEILLNIAQTKIINWSNNISSIE